MEKPIAIKLRPQNIDEIIGQDHLFSNTGFIRKMVERNKLFSMIFFGPPGTGKTTAAIAICNSLKLNYVLLNATINNKRDVEEAINKAKENGHLVIIMDEVHRLNKDKQDYLLDYIESGLITLIGATTANPYHSINPAIRSRCHLVEFHPLNKEHIIKILNNAIISKNGLNNEYKFDNDAIELIASFFVVFIHLNV